MNSFKIPIYSDLPPRQRQWVHMGLGGLAFVALFLVVSALIGGDPLAPSKTTPTAPPVKTLGSVPGENVDPQTVWIGGAGKTITTLQAELLSQRQAQDRMNQDMQRELAALRQSKSGSATTPAPADPPVSDATTAARTSRVAEGSTIGGERFPKTNTGTNAGPSTGTALPAATRQTGSNGPYPPGQPIGSAGQIASALPDPPLGVIKVTLAAAANATAGSASQPGGSTASGTKGPRKVETFLPVSFMRAVLLGGMDAPTGGQAQTDPIPVLLKITDNAFLPNEYRSAVKDCFVIAEGFGDVSSERAYIRTQLLSCVLKNGQSLEVHLKGNVFGEDGKNGMRGRLVTKQGAILANALLSGIAAGIGQGFAASGQTTTVSPLGSTTTNAGGTQNILKSGLGTGVGRAMDRLAQYYINLAERTFPVVEIDAGRIVDIVVTQGVVLDGSLTVTAEGGSPVNSRNIDRGALLNAVNEASND